MPKESLPIPLLDAVRAHRAAEFDKTEIERLTTNLRAKLEIFFEPFFSPDSHSLAEISAEIPDRSGPISIVLQANSFEDDNLLTNVRYTIYAPGENSLPYYTIGENKCAYEDGNGKEITTVLDIRGAINLIDRLSEDDVILTCDTQILHQDSTILTETTIRN